MDRSLVVVCCKQYSPPPSHISPHLTGYWDAAAFLLSWRDMPPFGVSVCLVGGLWGRDGGGAAVDQGGQLVEADDAEEVA